MSLGQKVYKGVSWLAFFKLISQVFSWTVTIVVARILIPEDYGLMEKATILTGYAAMFSELGLGAAIIQKPDINKRELSSVFWFSIAVSMLMVILCFILAIPTAMMFDDVRVIPITRSVSILFIIAGLQIVPLNLLKKNLEFKKVGFIEMSSVAISCASMVVIAYLGGGVWTLIGGHIIRNIIRLILAYTLTRWKPIFHFDAKEAKQFLKFGIYVAMGQSLFYIYEKSDRFFAGRAWNTSTLGLYSLALSLAIMPTEKIVVLINQVSYSALSKLQHDLKQFSNFYLKIIKITGLIVLPIFIGLFFVGDEMIRLFLNEKWHSMIPVFRLLCLAQIFTAINAINSFVHNALGKPKVSLLYNALVATLMPLSFFLAVKYGFKAILIPWLTVYPVITIIWIIFTTSQIKISIIQYLKNLGSPLISVLVMSLSLIPFEYFSVNLVENYRISIGINFGMKIVIGAITYIGSMWIFDKQAFVQFNQLRKKGA